MKFLKYIFAVVAGIGFIWLWFIFPITDSFNKGDALPLVTAICFALWVLYKLYHLD